MLPYITKYNVLFMTTGQFNTRKGDEGQTNESWKKPIRGGLHGSSFHAHYMRFSTPFHAHYMRLSTLFSFGVIFL
jgi:hypothetical protein